MRGYLARPANATGKLPGILVVHENRGLNPHIEDIARRLALDNFMAFAPDALTPLGGYPGDEDKARELFPKLDQAKTREDFVAAAAFLKARPECTGKVGAVGFCYGGGIANMLATRIPDLGGGGAVLRRPAAAPRTSPKIKAPLLIHYAGTDERINAGLAGVRGRAQGQQGEVRAVHLSRHAARLQQRHDAALRQGGGQARVAADGRLLQQEPAHDGAVGNDPGRPGTEGDPCDRALRCVAGLVCSHSRWLR